MTKTLPENPFEAPEVAATYDSWFDTPLGQAVDHWEMRLLNQMAQPRAGERALDVGAGTGYLACALARGGLRVTGLEPSRAMLTQARAKDCGVTWQRGIAEELPFAAGAFDLVVSLTVLEFVQDPERAVAEMMRVLAPGGRLVVGALNATGAWGAFYEAQAGDPESPFRHAHLYTPEEFLALLKPHGRVRWASAVYFGPSGRGVRWAGLLESFGRLSRPRRGALLVGRVEG